MTPSVISIARLATRHVVGKSNRSRFLGRRSPPRVVRSDHPVPIYTALPFSAFRPFCPISIAAGSFSLMHCRKPHVEGRKVPMPSYIPLFPLSHLSSLHHTHLSSIFLFTPSSFVIAALRLLDSCTLVVRFAEALRCVTVPPLPETLSPFGLVLVSSAVSS
jgi:hypothetical protein